LQTVFQFIDLCDELTFDIRADGLVRRIGSVLGVGQDDDLVVRAARLLRRATGTPLGADIRLDKQIPIGGGLGGGSSDAATTLLALNRLWDCGLDQGELMRLGLQLGADVPVFIHGRAAWAEGVGEQLHDIAPPTPIYLVLAPAVHVDTGLVFQDPELTRNSPRITIRDFLAGEQRNDCLPVVRRQYPLVAQVFDWLDERADARLTRTGACVFAACADRAEASALFRQRPPGVNGFLTQGMNRSPLFELMA
jgi:4-diphosphocytidyl-2-C-methyl-D-erythritol kinase